MDLRELEILAKKVQAGFSAQAITLEEMGLTRAEYQTVWRLMKKSNFEGSISFFIAQLCLNALESMSHECERAHIMEKIMLIKMESPEKSKQISELLGYDIEKISNLSTVKKMDAIPESYESIYYCASVAILSKLGTVKKDGKKIFHALKELIP